MIATLTDKAEARRRVALAAGFPTVAVTDAEIEGIAADPDADPPVAAVAGILDSCVLCSIWAASTVYTIRDLVIPTEANETGLWYRCRSSWGDAKSGATEPVWPRFRDWWINDGNCYWVAMGPAPAALWDLDMAIHKVLELKLNRAGGSASALKSFKLDARDEFNLGDLMGDLRAAVERTAPFLIG